MKNESVIARGIVDRIGINESYVQIETEKGKYKIVKEMPNHSVAIQSVLDLLTDRKHGCIENMSQINAVGHRVVHSGEDFNTSVKIDKSVLKIIASNVELAPLHMPPNIAGIESCLKSIPHAPAVAVFDTSFHSSIPQYAYMYALPYDDYKNYKIRKYGFHGTSHQYVSQQARQIFKKDGDFKLIVCHLGNGASISAVKNDKCVDTSMGFTPLDGLIMGTRSGSIDAAILEYLSKKTGMSLTQVVDYLNKKSGVLGISGISSDFRDLEQASKDGDERAKLAIAMFVYRVKTFIGAYSASMGGLDMVVFTAGVGENSSLIREYICYDMEYLGIDFDKSKNTSAIRGSIAEISSDKSRVKVHIIPTNEELVIARETLKFYK
jgi:acetate kinase